MSCQHDLLKLLECPYDSQHIVMAEFMEEHKAVCQQQDPLYGYFTTVAGLDEQINALELQRCLTLSGIAGTYKPFSLEACRLMIAMLDRDMSRTMGFDEFKKLLNFLNGWKATFRSYDLDYSGSVENAELQHALTNMGGFKLSPQAINIALEGNSTNGRISFDNFINLCIRIRALTDQFQRRVQSHTEHAKFQYDDFMQITLML